MYYMLQFLRVFLKVAMLSMALALLSSESHSTAAWYEIDSFKNSVLGL